MLVTPSEAEECVRAWSLGVDTPRAELCHLRAGTSPTFLRLSCVTNKIINRLERRQGQC